MAIEVLVTALCIGNYACPNALKAYYEHNPAVKIMARRAKTHAKQVLGETVMHIVPVAATLATQKVAHFNLGHNLSADIGPEKGVLLYGFTF